jgi:hypothetical protein
MKSMNNNNITRGTSAVGLEESLIVFGYFILVHNLFLAYRNNYYRATNECLGITDNGSLIEGVIFLVFSREHINCLVRTLNR